MDKQNYNFFFKYANLFSKKCNFGDFFGIFWLDIYRSSVYIGLFSIMTKARET